MILQVSLLSVDSVYSISSPTVNPFQPTTFNYYGNNTGLIIDSLWGKNTPMSEEDFNKFNRYNYFPQWSEDTYILAKFNHDLSAGNVTGITAPVKMWNVYRKKQGDTIIKQIGTMSPDHQVYNDWSATNGSYNYYMTASTENEMSGFIPSNDVTLNYDGWFLIDMEKNVSYRFSGNLGSEDINYVGNLTSYNVYNKYDAYSQGIKNYASGQISALISKDNLNMDFLQTTETLKNLRDFIISKRTKYLKDRRGRIFKVVTSDYTETSEGSDANGVYYLSSFSWRESGEVNESLVSQ